MNKEILISTKPQHCYTKLTGDKTIEVRKLKNVPKSVLEEIAKGNKVWFNEYVTKAEPLLGYGFTEGEDDGWGNRSDYLYSLSSYKDEFDEIEELKYILNGLVPYRYLVSKIDIIYFDKMDDITGTGEILESYYYEYYIHSGDLEKTCISYEQLKEYGKGQTLVLLHIEKIEIFDEPKKLSDFVSNKPIENVCGNEEKCFIPTASYFYEKGQVLTKAPQSMQTVWVEEE